MNKTDKLINKILEGCEVCGNDTYIPPSTQNAHSDDGDKESRMAMSDLYNLAENAKMLQELIGEDFPLEDWAEAKITKAADYIRSVFQYVKYEVSQDGEPEEGGHTTVYIATDPRTLGLKDTE